VTASHEGFKTWIRLGRADRWGGLRVGSDPGGGGCDIASDRLIFGGKLY
jgi:hypothetical protein